MTVWGDRRGAGWQAAGAERWRVRGRMRAEEIRDRETLEAWLTDQPREVAVMIAARAALRVAPLWDGLFRQKVKERAPEYLLALFRCTLTSNVAVGEATLQVRDAADEATASAASLPFARRAAASAAASAASAADSAATTSAVSLPFARAHAAATSASTAARATRSNAIALWKEVRGDALAVERGIEAEAVLSKQLWSSEHPQRLMDRWQALRRAMLVDHADWQFWIDWYECVLRGGLQNWAMLTEIVLIPHADWRQGPGHVNAIIAGIVEKHRARELVEREPPALDPALPLRVTDAGITLDTVSLTEGEVADPLRATLHEALGEQVGDLIRVAGNRDEAAYREACRLRDLLECGLAEMDPLRAHLAVEALRRIHDWLPADTDRDLMFALAQVIETGPGLTLDTAPVTLHLDRVHRNRRDRLSGEETEAQIRLARGIASSDLSAPDVRDLATKVSDPSVDDQLSLLRPTLTRNYVILVGISVVAPTYQHFVVTGEVGWLAAHGADILLAARSWGAPYVAWITPLVARAQEIVAGAAHMQAQFRRDRRDGS